MRLFRIRAIVALEVSEQKLLAGGEADIEPQLAAELIRSGKARLADAEDIAALMRALALVQTSAGGLPGAQFARRQGNQPSTDTR